MPEICRPACPRAPASGAGLGNTTGALDCDCGSYVLQIMGVVISAAPPVWEYSNVRPTRALLLENLHPLADTVLEAQGVEIEDRKSTRLNSSHVAISYAVFCLKNTQIQ